MQGHGHILCVAAGFNKAPTIVKMIGTDLFSESYKSQANASVDFAEAKASGKPIALLILGPIGHDAIKFLCDDYDKPQEERRVRWIHSLSAGIDWYQLDHLTSQVKGIPFTNGKGAYSYQLSVHVVYSILYFNRSTTRLQKLRAERRFDPFFMQETRGCKVGIVGYGDIGRACARAIQPLEMDVTGVRRTLGEEYVDEFGARVVGGDAERDRVIRESDYLINILPGTPDTAELFNKERFAQMKPNAVYINVGRGSTQNEVDLAAALRGGVIGGASLDVFQVEPLPADSPLYDIGDDKLLITAHNACITEKAFGGAVDIFLNYAKQFAKTGTVKGYTPDITAGY